MDLFIEFTRKGAYTLENEPQMGISIKKELRKNWFIIHSQRIILSVRNLISKLMWYTKLLCLKIIHHWTTRRAHSVHTHAHKMRLYQFQKVPEPKTLYLKEEKQQQEEEMKYVYGFDSLYCRREQQ